MKNFIYQQSANYFNTWAFVYVLRNSRDYKMQTDKDHIHILADIDPSFGVMKFIKTAKGRSSRILRQEFNHLKTKLPTLWTNSCFISTVGGVPLNVVKQYIENQQNSNRPKQKEKWKSYVDNLQTKAL